MVEVFRMLADATRVQVLWALVSREMSVNDLATHVGKPGPSVSQHLAKLRMARLVRTRREGTTILYSLDNDHVGQLVTDAVFNAEHAGPGMPGHHRDSADLATLHPDTDSADRPVRSKAAAHDPRHHPHGHDHGHNLTTTAHREMRSTTTFERCSHRTAMTPPTASTAPWSPAPRVSGR